MPTPNAEKKDERERAVALLWSVVFDLEMNFFLIENLENRLNGNHLRSLTE